MTKITIAIVAAAAVGSAEAWGRSYPTRKPTAPRGFAGNSKSLKEFGGSAHRHGKIGKCKGDCDYDYQCARGLKCFQQNWRYTTITGCEGRTKSNYDYCYDPTPTARPTRRPTTAMPTRKPTTAAHLNAKTLTDHGFSAHRLKNVVKAKGLGMCQGDCDSDTHCQGSMKCFHSSSGGNTVTGCEGKTSGITDYCYQPKPVTAAHLNAKKLTDHGFSAHTLTNVVKAKGLGMCQGDCDSNTHCQGSMVCFHSSSSGNTVTGCEGKTSGYTDYCYQPLKLSNPARCAEWSCKEWCLYFDQTVEDAGVYSKNGCVEDGVLSCACN